MAITPASSILPIIPWAQGAGTKPAANPIAPVPPPATKPATTAPVIQTGAASSGLIDLSQIGGMIDQQQAAAGNLIDATAAADARKVIITSGATQEQAKIGQASIASADDTREKQLGILGGLDTLSSKANLAIQLGDSGNPMDRLKLWALQQTDAAYTRDGNIRRMEYYNSAAAAYGGAELIRQDGFSDQIKTSQNKMLMALEPDNQMLQQMQIAVDQGQRKIDAAVTASTTRFDIMTKNNAIQQAAITDMSADEVAAATQIATNSKTQTANVKGVEISLGTLQERSATLEDRDYTRYSRNIQRQVNETSTIPQEEIDGLITEAEGSKDRSATRNGTKLSLSFLRERKANLSTQDFTQMQQNAQTMDVANNMKRRSDGRMLQTMNSTELSRIIDAGGYDPEDPTYQYDMDQVTEARNTRVSADAAKTQQGAAVAAIGDPNTAIVDYHNYQTAVSKSSGDNPALKTLMDSQKNVFAFASNLLTSSDPSQVAAGAELLQGLKTQTEDAITAEAKRMSAGDKDLELAYNAKLRGQPIPPETIASAIHDRVAKGKDLSQWLNPTQAVMYKNTFYAAKSDIQKNNPLLSANEVDDMAAEQAMQTLLPAISTGVTEQLLSMQMTIPSNPFYGNGWVTGMSPTRLLSIYKTADDAGIKNYQAQTGLSDEEMQKRITGQTADPGLNAAQASAFLMELDKTKPGLGQKYVDWWNGDGRNQLVAAYSTQVASNASQGKFQDLSQMSLVIPTLNDQMSTYATILNDGQKMSVGTELARQHQDYVTFGGSATAKQAFLLEQDSNLTPSDKKQAMTLIFDPLIKAAGAQKLNSEQTNMMIEQELQTMSPQDPATKKLLQKIKTNRDSSLKVIDDFAKAREPSGYMLTGPMGIPYSSGSSSGQAGVDDFAATYPWLKDWKKETQK